MSDKDLTLRLYQARDVPRGIDLIMNAIPQLPNYKMITPDRERIRYLLIHNIDNAHSFAGWALCDSNDIAQGMVAGWCVPNLISNDLVSDDALMWIEPEYRTFRNASLMIKTYVAWAESKGAKLIRASHTGGSFPKGSKEYELFDGLLQRMGFKEVGSVYHLTKYGDK